jgi:precorrin-6A/cobalt-precorrin-6A reductase
VTKGSGKVGDVSEKLEAARMERCRVVVVRRPEPPEEYFDQVEPLINVLLEALTP